MKSSIKKHATISVKHPETQNKITEVKAMPETENLEKIVAESKAALSAEDPKPLRKRGRPRKIVESDSTGAYGTGADTQKVEPQRAPSLTPILSHVVRLPYSIAAQKTGCEAVSLTEEESTELASLTDELLKIYLPNLGEKASVLVTCVGSFAVVSLSKYAIYQTWKNQKIKETRTMTVVKNASEKIEASQLNPEKIDPYYVSENKDAPISVDDFMPRGMQ